jgi:hypothetical protein
MAKAEFVLKDGTVLTPELEKQLADEAEAGYDLTQALRIDLRPGRPSRGEPAGESPRVAVRVPKDVYALARRRAGAEGRSLSAVLRELIAHYARGDSVTSSDVH